MTTNSTASDLLDQSGKRRFGFIKIPALNLRYRIRSLSERERNQFESTLLDPKKGTIKVDRLKMAKVNLIALCIVDDDGNRVFSQLDAKSLLEVDSAITNELHDQITDFIGFADGDVEKLVKNSETTASED